MPLIILLSLSAFSLAAASGFFSVVGLATTFAGSFWAVVALGSTIEFGKLVAVSFLYRFWGDINVLTKMLLITIVSLVMFVTSFGVFGFLTHANQTDMIALKQSNSTLEFLISEEKQLQMRKTQIDQQVSQLKDTDVSGRVKLSKQFSAEISTINKRLPVIAIEKQKLASTQITQQADVGPMIYLAKTFGYDVDVAVTWFTILLVLVFDPLAVLLTICTNIAIAKRAEDKGIDKIPVIVQNVTRVDPIAPPATMKHQEPPLPVEQVISKPSWTVKFNQLSPQTPADVKYTFSDPIITPGITSPTLEPLNITLMQSDWTHFSNKIKSDDELSAKIAQLQQYIADLESRSDPLTSDEQILKERIIAFIQRKQSESMDQEA
jgi:hypothetical protein